MLALGGIMWRSLKNFAYRTMYSWGMAPPSSADVSAALERIQAKRRTVATEAATSLCDCQVLAGGQMIDCRKGISKVSCDLINDEMPGVTGVPLPLGSCANIPHASSK